VKYFITSGNSQTGLATIKALKAAGEHDIVAGARDPKKSEADLKAAGASQVVEVDLSKPETLKKALPGAERVLIVHNGSPDAVQWARNVVEVGKDIPSIKVYSRIAGLVQDENSPIWFVKAHASAATLLRDSGKQWFTVGPGFFFENFLAKAQEYKSGSVTVASGDGKISFISASDIGAVAAGALRNPEKYNGQHLPITGGEAASEAEVYAALNEATGKHTKVVHVTIDQFKQALKDKHYPDQVVDLLATLEQMKASGEAAGLTENVKKVAGKDPVSVKEWAKQNASAFV